MTHDRLGLVAALTLAFAGLTGPVAHASPRQFSAGDPFAQQSVFAPNGKPQRGGHAHAGKGTHLSTGGPVKAIGRQRGAFSGRGHRH